MVLKCLHARIKCKLTDYYQQLSIIYMSIYLEMNLLHCLQFSQRLRCQLQHKFEMTTMRINAFMRIRINALIRINADYRKLTNIHAILQQPLLLSVRHK